MPEYPDRQSPHLQWYDYSGAGRYAVTICTHDHEFLFGDIRAERMYFSEVGRIVRTFWYSLPDRFPGVCLDAFVLMPNHVHGIVVIPSRGLNVENMPERFQPSMRALMQERHPELRDSKPPTLGAIIRAYKAAATYRISVTRDRPDCHRVPTPLAPRPASLRTPPSSPCSVSIIHMLAPIYIIEPRSDADLPGPA